MINLENFNENADLIALWCDYLIYHSKKFVSSIQDNVENDQPIIIDLINDYFYHGGLLCRLIKQNESLLREMLGHCKTSPKIQRNEKSKLESFNWLLDQYESKARELVESGKKLIERMQNPQADFNEYAENVAAHINNWNRYLYDSGRIMEYYCRILAQINKLNNEGLVFAEDVVFVKGKIIIDEKETTIDDDQTVMTRNHDVYKLNNSYLGKTTQINNETPDTYFEKSKKYQANFMKINDYILLDIIT